MNSSGIWTILLWVAVVLVWVVPRMFIVHRTGRSFWLGIIWAIPVIGWFFKIWLATADWPNVKEPKRSKPRAKGKSSKKVAV